MSFTDFSRSTLIECDFTEANLSWTDFTFTNLTKSKFTKADISYTILNNAIVDGADFSYADIGWSLAFDCRLEAANLKGANIATIARSISDITEEGMKHVEEMVGRLKSSIPFDLWLAILHSIEKTKGTREIVQELSRETVKAYESRKEQSTHISTGEYAGGEKGLYTERAAYGFETQYARGSHRESKGEYMR